MSTIGTWHIYIKDGSYYLPTVGLTVDGPSLEIDPVVKRESVSIEQVNALVVEHIKAGNPTISREIWNKVISGTPVIQKAMGLKSWNQVGKKSSAYFVHLTTESYSVHYCRPNLSKGEDAETIATLPKEVDLLTVVECVVTHIKKTL